MKKIFLFNVLDIQISPNYLNFQLSDFIPIGIDHQRIPHLGFGGCFHFVDVVVSVKMIFRLEGFDQPVESLDALMGPVRFVVDAERRGVGDEHIQRTAVDEAIKDQTWHKLENMSPHLGRGILEIPTIVAIATLDPRKDDLIFDKNFAVQIDPAARSVTITICIIFDEHIMIAAHEDQWCIQLFGDVFLIVIGQVAAADDHVHIADEIDDLGAVQGRDDLVADGEDFQGKVLDGRGGVTPPLLITRGSSSAAF